MSKCSNPLSIFAAAIALCALSSSVLADTNTDNLYLQTGQRDTSALNQFDGTAVQASAMQATTDMQQNVAQQVEQNKNYIQQVQQQIIQASGDAASNSAQTTTTTNAPQTSTTAPTPQPQSNVVTPTTPAKSTNNDAAVQTNTPAASSAPTTPTGLDSGSAPNNGGSWNYGF